MTVSLHNDLSGQVALVSGATRGIGYEIARGLAASGATVFAGARTPSDLSDSELLPIKLDVTDTETIEAAITRITEMDGVLDILVNNAGIAGPRKPLHMNAIDTIDETFAVNLRGPTLLTRAAIPLLSTCAGSRIINVSSGMGAVGEGMSGRYPAYRVSKAGLNGLTAYLHGEYRIDGVLANSACPGWVRTDLGSPDASKSPKEGADTPVWLAHFTAESPSGLFWRDREQIDW